MLLGSWASKTMRVKQTNKVPKQSLRAQKAKRRSSRRKWNKNTENTKLN